MVIFLIDFIKINIRSVNIFFRFFLTTYVIGPTILSKYSSLGDYKDVDEYDLIELYVHQIISQPM